MIKKNCFLEYIILMLQVAICLLNKSDFLICAMCFFSHKNIYIMSSVFYIGTHLDEAGQLYQRSLLNVLIQG